MKKNNRGEIILTQKEFMNTLQSDKDMVEELIDLWGSETTLKEVAEILREIKEFDGEE